MALGIEADATEVVADAVERHAFTVAFGAAEIDIGAIGGTSGEGLHVVIAINE